VPRPLLAGSTPGTGRGADRQSGAAQSMGPKLPYMEGNGPVEPGGDGFAVRMLPIPWFLMHL
jgi:hypothetical protein